MEGGGSTSSSGSETLARLKAGNRWLLAVQFEWVNNSAGGAFDWVSLFSNTCSAESLFETHRDGRRIETLWLGTQRRGDALVCFFQHVAARNTKVLFTALEDAAPNQWPDLQFEDGALKTHLEKCDTGREAFQRLCEHYQLPLPLPAMEHRDGKFVHRGTGNVGDWKLFWIHEI